MKNLKNILSLITVTVLCFAFALIPAIVISATCKDIQPTDIQSVFLIIMGGTSSVVFGMVGGDYLINFFDSIKW